MRKLLLLFLFILPLMATPRVYSVSYYVKVFKNLNPDQKRIMKMVWEKAKPYNLQYTMVAIAYRESLLGKQMYNLKDGQLGSYGIFHNLVESVYERYVTIKPKDKNVEISIKLALAKRLVDDFDFSFSQALAELKFWENLAKAKKVKNVWRYMVIHYNGGYNGHLKQASIIYYKNIVNIIRAIKILQREGLVSLD